MSRPTVRDVEEAYRSASFLRCHRCGSWVPSVRLPNKVLCLRCYLLGGVSGVEDLVVVTTDRTEGTCCGG